MLLDLSQYFFQHAHFPFSQVAIYRAPDKNRLLFSRMPISSPNPTFDHLLESSHQDDSNKWSKIGFTEEITQTE